MDPTFLIMWFGFILAGYSVVGNDSIQTLGTFLSSNEERPWYILWLFAGSILTFTLVYGWYQYGGDVSYERLSKYPFIEDISWPYLLPPLVLMILTRTGIPVSTSFLILTFFKPKGLLGMTMKSLLGYVLAFALAILVWQVGSGNVDILFGRNDLTKGLLFAEMIVDGLGEMVLIDGISFLVSDWHFREDGNVSNAERLSLQKFQHPRDFVQHGSDMDFFFVTSLEERVAIIVGRKSVSNAL